MLKRENAMKIYANSEAASYFQSAAKLLEEREGSLRERARILETLGDLKSLMEDYDLCMRYWDEALLLWEQSGAKETTARLHRKMGFVLFRSMEENEKAKQKYLPGFVSGEVVAAFALTEPNHGSDLNNLETTAILKGDEYIVNGVKYYAGGSPIADAYVTFVRTDPSVLGSRGIGAMPACPRGTQPTSLHPI
jgi:tetratricopeptide (TPR) repeat protein